ncbi:MAG: hypothetical protein JEZ04_02710 [Spirochaetales bacterium]|nr:hypothetical protein [Spirochaetales bacterium]
MKALRPLSIIVIVLLSVSCASMRTSQSQYVEAEVHVRQRNYLAAAAIIEESKGKTYQEKERVLYYLDLGMLYHYAGKYEESNSALSEAEYGIEELYTQSISKAIGSGLLNDNALDYDGEVYEDLYINIFKSLNYIALDDTESALVEVRRVNNKLNLLQDKYNLMYDQYSRSSESSKAVVPKVINEFHNDALARYIGCVLYRNMGDWDDARIDRGLIKESYLSQPELYPFPAPSPPDASPAEGHELPVNFFVFTGQSPNKVATTYYINSQHDMITFSSLEQNSGDYLYQMTGLTAMYVPGIEAGFHIKFQFPRMENRSVPVNNIRVYADDSLIADLGLTEDMEHIAQRTFSKELPLTVGKTVTRALIKGIVKEAADQAIDKEIEGSGLGLLKSIFDIATDVAVDATENADLRVSNFFPAQAYTGEAYLSPGTYNFRIEYYNSGHLLFIDSKENMEINKDNSIIESFFIF